MLGCSCPSEMHALYLLVCAQPLPTVPKRKKSPCHHRKHRAVLREPKAFFTCFRFPPSFLFLTLFKMFARDVRYPSTGVSTLWGLWGPGAPPEAQRDPRAQELPPAAFPDFQKQEEQENAFAKEIIFLISGAPADRNKLSSPVGKHSADFTFLNNGAKAVPRNPEPLLLSDGC